MHILAYLSFGFMLIFKTDATASISAPATDGAACTVATIAEGTLGTTFTDTISTVTATASGGGATISYALSAGGDSVQFDIDSSTGVVTLKNAATVDYDALTNKYLTVKMEAVDSVGPATSTISCTVSVTDVAPTFTADAIATSVRVSKDAAVGTVIGDFSCLDGGQGTITVALSPATHTYFEVSTTNLQTKAALTSVSGQTYSLTLTCTDGTTTISQAVSACIDVFCSGAINISGISSALFALVLYFMHKLF